MLPWALIHTPSYKFIKVHIHGMVIKAGQTPAASTAAGCASAVVRVWVSVVKSRLQLNHHAAALEAAPYARRTAGLYVGFRVTVTLDVSYTCAQFFCRY